MQAPSSSWYYMKEGWFSEQEVGPVGDATFLTLVENKRLIFITDMDSKTIRYTSVGNVERFTNGVLAVRTSGRNVFLRFLRESTDNQRIALLIERMCLHESTTGVASMPTGPFETVETADAMPPVRSSDVIMAEATSEDEPRYTFRVVGDHIDDRRAFIQRLRISEQIFVVREPDNPADHNAVAVVDRNRNMLGYLKREVAEWFAPKMDRGQAFYADVHRIRDDGALIVGVYEM
jgi:hypothetical protein